VDGGDILLGERAHHEAGAVLDGCLISGATDSGGNVVDLSAGAR